MLHIKSLTYRIGGRVLFDGASLSVPTGHKVGLVGRNGTGKTTLLRLIAGELQPDGGDISVPSRTRVGRIAQEAPGDERSLLATVLAADRERSALLDEAERATDPHRIAEVHTRLAEIAAHAAPARAARILAGLGFDGAAQERATATLSGGLRMRVSLAALLFSEPELLLLDEPTNHLDLETTLWLEGYLRSYPHTVILVSHDRRLLNAAAGHIAHLSGGKLTLFTGNFDAFQRARSEQQRLSEKARAKQEAQRRHMQAFVDRFRYKASKARQAQSRLKMLARMETIAEVRDDPSAVFDFPAPQALAPPLMTIEGGQAGYDGRVVLDRLDLRIDPDDRIALLGANGNGKSTLVKLLAGRLRPMAGEVRRPSKLKVGYFAQHQQDELVGAETAVQHLARLLPKAIEPRLRAHLGRFGLTQERAETPVADLSGGEKARLLLALMSHNAPHLLLLDEPTNHLDIDAREALIEAMNDFSGAIILVTHDPHLIELTADRLWLVANGTCRPYDGDLDGYRNAVLGGDRRELSSGHGAPSPSPGARKARRQAAAQDREATAHLRKAARQAERRAGELQQRLSALEARLADPALYVDSPERLVALQKDHAATKAAAGEAEEAWLEAQLALESEPT